ncbi:MAG: hypothetical protein HC831_19150 [Chloroflexia bacterium]|nr:hypothetical protein [Chloroflexia bacterium]
MFISYPMVEALKHQSKSLNFKDLKVQAGENINYKKLVNDDTFNELKQINRYTEETWHQLIDLHLCKVNYIINGDFTFPQYYFNQTDIFLKQLEKYINVDYTVGVLSSFPVFLFDYYGYEYLLRLISDDRQ